MNCAHVVRLIFIFLICPSKQVWGQAGLVASLLIPEGVASLNENALTLFA
jgi:hypothetical protein